jgi:cytidylate kinase
MSTIVAIDGPAGSGKSSVAKAVASALGFSYVDTGAIYRTVALMCVQHGVDGDDAESVARLARELPEWIKNRDVSKQIRSEAIAQMSSRVSKHPQVRAALMDLQRSLGRSSPKGAVLEGRDIGTVVFPDADMKFFLTASDEQRAKRRFAELQSRHERATYEDVLAEIQVRDQRDKNREVAPLVAASDAIVIDTTEHSQTEVCELIVGAISQQLGLKP